MLLCKNFFFLIFWNKLGDQVAEYSQQIIDMQREIEQQAIRRREERIPDAYTPHMPPRLINSSTIRELILTPGFSLSKFLKFFSKVRLFIQSHLAVPTPVQIIIHMLRH